MEDDRYEGIELILRSRDDGQSWFDVLFDMIAADCQGDPESEESTCTCGMEHMGGTIGTYDQVNAWTTSVGQGLQPIDLARAIVALADGKNAVGPVIDWAHNEIRFEEYFENREWENEEQP